MKSKPEIQSYINNFRRRIAKFLRPGIGIRCSIYPARTGGALLEFKIGPQVENDDDYKKQFKNLSSALAATKQHAFGGNLNAFRFSGTNVIMEQDKIIFIKDESPEQWTDSAAEHDVQIIVRPPVRGHQ